MAATGLFDEENSAESYYIAEDGRLFAISQDIPLALDSTRIQEIREIPLKSSVEGTEIQQILNVSPAPDHDIQLASAAADEIQNIHEIQLEEPPPNIESMETESLLTQQENLIVSKDEKKETAISIPLSDVSADQLLFGSSDKKSVTIEDFIEIYTIFKCKACDFTSGQKDGLYSHIEEQHLKNLRTLEEAKGSDVIIPQSNENALPQNRQEIMPQKGDDILPGHISSMTVETNEVTDMMEQNRESSALNDMLVIQDVENVQYNMENRTETVILEDVPATEKSNPYRYQYFKFFLVKEQKELFICTKCSVCVYSEEKMKTHVMENTCVQAKCKNCGLRFNNPGEYHTHVLKCQIAFFKLKEKPARVGVEGGGEKESGADDSFTLPEVEETDGNQSLVNQLYNKEPAEVDANVDASEHANMSVSEENVDDELEDEEEQVFGEEYKILRLTKNRTGLEIDGDKRVWVCSVKSCYAIFKEENMLDYHTNCHKGDEVVCLDCEKRFPRWPELASHLWREHRKNCDMYECVQCREYKASTVPALYKHCQTHANLKNFECDVCFKSFNQLSQLKNHSVSHLTTTDHLPNWAKPKKCDLCENIYSDSKSLKKHVQAVHSQLKPYICPICSHKSSRKDNLRLHMRQHTGEKPFHCDMCAYKTGDRNSLRRHKKVHSGEKPFKCHICSYQTIQSNNYRAHLQQKHQITPDGKPVEVKKKKKKCIMLKGRTLLPLVPEQREFILPDKPDQNMSLADSLDSLLGMSRQDNAM